MELTLFVILFFGAVALGVGWFLVWFNPIDRFSTLAP